MSDYIIGLALRLSRDQRIRPFLKNSGINFDSFINAIEENLKEAYGKGLADRGEEKKRGGCFICGKDNNGGKTGNVPICLPCYKSEDPEVRKKIYDETERREKA